MKTLKTDVLTTDRKLTSLGLMDYVAYRNYAVMRTENIELGKFNLVSIEGYPIELEKFENCVMLSMQNEMELPHARYWENGLRKIFRSLTVGVKEQW